MFREGSLDKILCSIKKLTPRPVFDFFAPVYHWGLAVVGAVWYGFPSHRLKIIGVTGTKGKSTTVYMITRILADIGLPVAAVGSLGFKIKEREWPNTLKMTMPGRTKLQKFLWQAERAGCKYVVMEVTSEGIAQHRLAGVNIDCAVFTNLHREHLESHGSFANYLKAKQKLFYKTKHIQILNIDDPYFEKFANFPARLKVTYGMGMAMISSLKFKDLKLKLLGNFNEYNALAALAVADAYRLDMKKAVVTLNSIESIPGRMEVINSPKGFRVIVDYAHTPDSLELVYKNLRNLLEARSYKLGTTQINRRLICVLGAAGGGRDKWKRPEFGKITGDYCDEVILTNEDPYDEDPGQIIEQVALGVPKSKKLTKILDRGEAIRHALTIAHKGDIVAITGKGSETSIAIAGGKKIPWSDKTEVLKSL